MDVYALKQSNIVQDNINLHDSLKNNIQVIKTIATFHVKKRIVSHLS